MIICIFCNSAVIRRVNKSIFTVNKFNEKLLVHHDQRTLYLSDRLYLCTELHWRREKSNLSARMMIACPQFTQKPNKSAVNHSYMYSTNCRNITPISGNSVPHIYSFTGPNRRIIIPISENTFLAIWVFMN